ncbi:MAG: ribose 5-phosphate isomerase B [Spirochaetes bacterium]|nr:ribose 5-phosphate isomerase B [Spirochaetota bacterium]
MTKPTIVVASDHAGFKLKEYLKKRLVGLGYKIKDVGTDSEMSVDYPDYISKGARAVAKDKNARGIFICGSGVGASMVANKIKNIRAALVYSKDSARLSRLHNDANVMTLGERLTRPSKAFKLVRIWLGTDFSNGERHIRRIEKISKLDGRS